MNFRVESYLINPIPNGRTDKLRENFWKYEKGEKVMRDWVIGNDSTYARSETQVYPENDKAAKREL